MKNRLLLTILITTIITVLGCQDNSSTDSQKPYLMNSKNTAPLESKVKEPSQAETKITLTSIEAKHKEALASIYAEKEKSIKKLELEQMKIVNSTRQAINKTEHDSQVIIQEYKYKYAASTAKEDATLYQQYLIGMVLMLLAILLLVFLIHRRNQTLKTKMHEDELRHEAHMQESQQYHERINKTLEILVDESTDKGLKKELVRLLKDQGGQRSKLLK